MTYRYPVIPRLLSITHSHGRRDEADGRKTRWREGAWGNRAMSSRFLSAGLAAAMIVGLAADAWAQAGSRSVARRRPPDQAPTAQGKAEAEGGEPAAAPAETSFDSAEDPSTKDGFDQ